MALTQTQVDEWIELRGIWRKSPTLYARQRLGLKPTVQQQSMLDAIAPPGAKVTVRAGHGVGKSAAESGILWWFLECFDHPRIPCTAPTSSQLYDILWAEAVKWMRRSDEVSKKNGLPKELWLSTLFRVTQDRIQEAGSPQTWYAVARTSRKENPDALQGFHASDLEISEDGTGATQRSEAGGSILFIIEEASGVPDEVFQVAEGALSSHGSRLLMVGNPTRNTGFFARSHKADRDTYTPLHFRCSDSALVDPQYRPNLVKKYGEGSNVVRVRADGEFPKQDDDVLIPLEHAEAAIARDDALEGEDRRLGVDVARFGTDRTVFTLRCGARVEYVEVQAKKDTMEVAARAKVLSERLNATAVYVDVIGVGAGVVDKLKLDGVEVVAVNAAEVAPNRSANKDDAQGRIMRDYLWIEMARWLREDEPAFLLDKDLAEDLAGELASVKYGIDGKGYLTVEMKDQMRKRLGRSPDLADSLALTFAPKLGFGILDYYRQMFEEREQAKADRADQVMNREIPQIS